MCTNPFSWMKQTNFLFLLTLLIDLILQTPLKLNKWNYFYKNSFLLIFFIVHLLLLFPDTINSKRQISSNLHWLHNHKNCEKHSPSLSHQLHELSNFDFIHVKSYTFLWWLVSKQIPSSSHDISLPYSVFTFHWKCIVFFLLSFLLFFFLFQVLFLLTLTQNPKREKS